MLPRAPGNRRDRYLNLRDGAGVTPSVKARRRAYLKKPVRAVDVTNGKGIGDLLDQFRSSSIQARNLGRCLEVWENALTDQKRPTILLGLSGPLIAAGLRKVLRDLVDWGLVDVVVTTGAVMYQDLYQTIGGHHWMGTPTANDVELRDLYLDRIYDTYVDELKFEDTDRVIGKITEQFPRRPASSREFLQFLGERFDDPDSILATAARRGVPVFSPALIDSSIGIGLTLYYQANRKRKDRFILDAIRDNYELVQILAHSPRTAVVYIGGGNSEELDQRRDRHGELRVRPGRRGPLLRAPDHDRRPALGRSLGQHARRGAVLGKDLEDRDARDGARGRLHRTAAARRRALGPPQGLATADAPQVPLDGRRGLDPTRKARDRTRLPIVWVDPDDVKPVIACDAGALLRPVQQGPSGGGSEPNLRILGLVRISTCSCAPYN